MMTETLTPIQTAIEGVGEELELQDFNERAVQNILNRARGIIDREILRCYSNPVPARKAILECQKTVLQAIGHFAQHEEVSYPGTIQKCGAAIGALGRAYRGIEPESNLSIDDTLQASATAFKLLGQAIDLMV